jgi:hypothetical protein
MDISEVGEIAQALAGVHRSTADGLAQWRYHGRLVEAAWQLQRKTG